jgi:hypothetical protein
MVIIKEGFSFIAGVLNIFWALYHKMWPLVGTIVFMHCALLAMQEYTAYNMIPFLQLITFLGFSFFASDLQEYALLKQNYVLKDTVIASSNLEAELKFFSRNYNFNRHNEK